MGNLLDLVGEYYAALNAGDAERVVACFKPDAVHYFTRMAPCHGAHVIAAQACAAVENAQAMWLLENGVEDGEQACIEWTMLWTDPGNGERRLARGTEWFRFEDGLISEVRAYHHGSKSNPAGDLIGFDHSSRGYTTLDDAG